MSPRLSPWAAARLVAACCAVSVTGSLATAAALDEPIKAVPHAAPQDRLKVALGQRLFNDVRLSGNSTISCASCHDIGRGGADPRPLSRGLHGRPTELNTPSVLNAALNFRQFWNGRAATLEAQIDAVVRNPLEMGGDWPGIIERLGRDPGYLQAFGAAYRDGLTAGNVRHALATYERTLVTPDSRFDRYLRGDANAITAPEKAGYARFKQYGCVACHQGVNVGGNMFQKFGVMGDYFANRRDGNLGRFLATGNPDDRHVFKVPGLRNVARTAPYFHDGSAATLEEAIDVMFKYQLGRLGSKQDKALIALFLRTLDSAPLVLP